MPYIRPINIAIHSSQWLETFQAVGDLDVSKITDMPDLITAFEVFKHLVIQITMSVSDQTYTGQTK